jgi:hypothetical protein
MQAEARAIVTHNMPARWTALVCFLLLGLWTAGPAAAEVGDTVPVAPPVAAVVKTAPVVIDGNTLFFVRGAQSYSAKERAARAESHQSGSYPAAAK